MDDRAFTPRDVLSRIHAALKEPPAKLAAVIVSQSEQIKALGREYADVAELVTMAHEVAGAPAWRTGQCEHRENHPVSPRTRYEAPEWNPRVSRRNSY